MGWFLLMAAGAEDRFLLARQALRGLRVRDLVVRDPVTTGPDVTIGEFIDDVAWKARHTTYPVTDNGHALGLLPLRCVADVPRSEWEQRTVRDCMVPAEEVPVVSENDELIDAAAELAESDINRALVVDGDRFVGLLSATDVARALEIRRAAGRPRIRI
jgi:predicted transcriptional regulator